MQILRIHNGEKSGKQKSLEETRLLFSHLEVLLSKLIKADSTMTIATIRILKDEL